VNLKPTASPRVSAAGIPGAEYGQAAYNIAYPTRPALPDGALNVAYPALQFLVKGGFSPYLFTIEEGQLPQGMTFSKSGILSGVPIETGNFHFTIRIVDGLLFYPSALRTSYTLHIAAEAPVISTNMIPPVVNVGSAASQPEDSGSPSSPTTPPAQAPAPAPAQAPTQVTVSSAQPEPVQNVQAPQPKEPKPPKKPPKGKGKGG
jgi:hypothetical protein